MKPIPEIVKEYVIKTHGRMPKSNKEVDYYLDLISHAKEYSEAFKMENLIGKAMTKKLGFATTDQSLDRILIKEKLKTEI